MNNVLCHLKHCFIRILGNTNRKLRTFYKGPIYKNMHANIWKQVKIFIHDIIKNFYFPVHHETYFHKIYSNVKLALIIKNQYLLLALSFLGTTVGSFDFCLSGEKVSQVKGIIPSILEILHWNGFYMQCVNNFFLTQYSIMNFF